jgi:hypothetical protein
MLTVHVASLVPLVLSRWMLFYAPIQTAYFYGFKGALPVDSFYGPSDRRSRYRLRLPNANLLELGGYKYSTTVYL